MAVGKIVEETAEKGVRPAAEGLAKFFLWFGKSSGEKAAEETAKAIRNAERVDPTFNAGKSGTDTAQAIKADPVKVKSAAANEDALASLAKAKAAGEAERAGVTGAKPAAATSKAEESAANTQAKSTEKAAAGETASEGAKTGTKFHSSDTSATENLARDVRDLRADLNAKSSVFERGQRKLSNWARELDIPLFLKLPLRAVVGAIGPAAKHPILTGVGVYGVSNAATLEKDGPVAIGKKLVSDGSDLALGAVHLAEKAGPIVGNTAKWTISQVASILPVAMTTTLGIGQGAMAQAGEESQRVKSTLATTGGTDMSLKSQAGKKLLEEGVEHKDKLVSAVETVKDKNTGDTKTTDATPKVQGKSADQIAEEKQEAEVEARVQKAGKDAESASLANGDDAETAAANANAAITARRVKEAKDALTDLDTNKKGDSERAKKLRANFAQFEGASQAAADKAKAVASAGFGELKEAAGKPGGWMFALFALMGHNPNKGKADNALTMGVFGTLGMIIGKAFGLENLPNMVKGWMGQPSSPTYAMNTPSVQQVPPSLTPARTVAQPAQEQQPARQGTPVPPVIISTPVSPVEAAANAEAERIIDAQTGPAESYPVPGHQPVPAADTVPVTGDDRRAVNTVGPDGEPFKSLAVAQADAAIKTAQATSKAAVSAPAGNDPIKLFEMAKAPAAVAVAQNDKKAASPELQVN